MSSRFLLISLGILAVLALVLFVFQPDYQFRGSVIEQEYTAPVIELLDSKGESYFLSEQKGKIVLLFFGYASCPDVCPTTMAVLKRTNELLDEEADQIQVVFITLDPDRDTSEKIQAYTSLFDTTFIGLSGDLEVLEPIWESYGVFREIDEETLTAAGYLVSHSSRTYLIDQDGNLKVTYTYGTDPEDIAKDIQHLLKAKD